MTESQDLFIVDATYTVTDSKEPIIHLFCRGEDGKSYQIDVRGFRPYFFVPKSASIPPDVTSKIIEIQNTNLKTLDGREVKKIVTRIPTDVKEMRDKFPETFEADIVFVKRFLFDKSVFLWIKKPDTNYVKGNLVDLRTQVHESKIEPLHHEALPSKLKVAAMDIECLNPPNRFPDPNHDPIISISLVTKENGDYKRYFFVWHKNPEEYLKLRERLKEEYGIEMFIYSSERLMLSEFKKFIWKNDFDVFLGWNSSKFDYPYVVLRMKKLGIDPFLGRISKQPKVSENGVEIPGRVFLDLMEMLKLLGERFESWKLDTVAKAVLGTGKVELEHGGQRQGQDIVSSWRSADELFVLYNVTDSELVFKINEIKRALDAFVMQAVVGGVFIYDVKKKTAIFDSLVLREARKRGLVLPTKKESAKGYKYSGARVLEPVKGLHKYVAYLDFASLYPNIMITFNVSFDTKDPNGEIVAPDTGVRFRHPAKGLGIVPSLEKYLLDRRKEAKALKKKYKKLAENETDPEKKAEYKRLAEYYDVLQLAFKIIANSFYGAMGYEKNRVFDVDVAESITAFGRYLNWFTEMKVRGWGYEVVYGDTDSIFVKTGAKNLQEAFDIAYKLTDKLNHEYKAHIKEKWNIDPEYNTIEIKVEGVFEKILFSGVKKRYVGIFYEDPDGKPKLEIKGFETKRTDWSPLAQELQKLAAKYALEENIEEFKKILKDYVDRMLRGELDDKLVIYKQITKDPKEYKAMPPHVRAFIKAKSMGKMVFVGDKIGIIKTRKDWEPVIDPEDLQRVKGNIDYDYYIEKQIKPAVERILAAFNLKFEDVYEGRRQTTLDSFF
jgi:DNA polymerase I